MPPKRKQESEMSESPPKRVTRARAKKDADTKPPTTRITTDSARASAQKKKAAPPKSSKRKAVVEEEDSEVANNVIIEEPPVEKPRKSRAKSKIAAAKISDKVEAEKDKTTQKAQSEKDVVVEKKDIPPKTRRGAKKPEVVQPPVATLIEEDVTKIAPPAKLTRGRPANITTKPATTRAKAAAAAAPKKKVKFDDAPQQDMDDKENKPLTLEPKKATVEKATGLRAKPIRKPAVRNATTRKKMATAVESTTEDKPSTEPSLPLSPKKVTQVAKAVSLGSEDELSEDKTPMRAMSKSPSKIPMSVNRDNGITASKLDLETMKAPLSPTKGTSPSKLSLSPRRPPPSPFKDALKDLPRRVDMGGRIAQSEFDASLSPPKSPLKESPKRVNLGDLGTQPIFRSTKTPVKASLFRSPARRPGGSSMKPPSTMPHIKSSSDVFMDDANIASTQTQRFKVQPFSAQKSNFRPFQAELAPRRPLEFHKATPTKYHQDIEKDAIGLLPEEKAISPATEPSYLAPDSPQDALGSGKTLRSQQEVLAPRSLRVQSSEYAEDASLDDEVSSLIEAEEPGADPNFREVDVGLVAEGMPSAKRDQAKRKSHISTVPSAFMMAPQVFRTSIEESDSEDELSSPCKMYSPTPLREFNVSSKDFATPETRVTAPNKIIPASSRQELTHKGASDSISFTPLVVQMSNWLASSPEKEKDSGKRGVFSSIGPKWSRSSFEPSAGNTGSPVKQSFFEDEMTFRDTLDDFIDEELDQTEEAQDNEAHIDLRASFDSQVSEDYGDENAVPNELVNGISLQEGRDETLTCTPAKVFQQQPREIHTVSKVPLRPAADDTPLIIPRKRSRSLAGPLSVISMPDRLSISRDSILSPILQDTNLSMNMLVGDPAAPDTPKTPQCGMDSALVTPGRTIRKAGISSVLKGAVVYVDVHTSEGADASGIFIDLLTQMGARCIKQWHWNPRASMVGGAEGSPTASPEAGASGNKIGITHVVYKDGGKRTLEKVRDSQGVVLCVGVGWVLE